MKRNSLLLLGLAVGATALGAVAPPAHAESSRDDSQRSGKSDSNRLRPTSGSRSGGDSSYRLRGGSSDRSDARSNGGFGSLNSNRSSSLNVNPFRNSNSLDRGNSVRLGNRWGGDGSSSTQQRSASPQRNFDRSDSSFGRDSQRRSDSLSGDPYRQRSSSNFDLSSRNDRHDSERRDGSSSRSWNDRGSVTDAGRVLGATRTVDRDGRTSVGRALGAAGQNGFANRGSILRPPLRGRSPVFGYNSHSGHYEPFRDRSGPFVSVLIGTVEPRPLYHFHYRNFGGTYYYPYYCDSVATIGFSAFLSPYCYFGFGVPAYIPSTRVVVVDRPVIIAGDDDADDYYLNRTEEQSLDDATSDIRQAWVAGDLDLLLRHVRTDEDIPVYLKDEYKYSLHADDYRDLTKDAMENSTTTSFKWVDVDRTSGNEAHLRAIHRFEDKDGTTHEVYATFTLVRSDGAWWIAEVGSSDQADE